MRILQVNKKFPFPLTDGESMAVNALANGLHQNGADVHLFALNTRKHRFSGSTLDIASQLPHYQSVTISLIDTSFSIFPAMYDIFSHGNYQVNRFHSGEVEADLTALLKKITFDVIQLESTYVLPYLPIIRKYHTGLVSLRAHNVESEIWKRLAGNESNVLKKLYFNFLSRKLAKYESAQLGQIDLLLPVSDHDGRLFRQMGYRKECLTCTIGMELKMKQVKDSGLDILHLGFIGSMDWRPNIMGMDWFIKNVLPRLKDHYGSKFTLTIAGRFSQEAFGNLQSDHVSVLGEVESSSNFLSGIDILVVPLFSGSGTRVKILEAFATGTPVVTTTLGIEGIPAQDGTHALIVDSAEHFQRAIIELAGSPDDVRRLRTKGAELIEMQYEPRKVGQLLYKKYAAMLEKNIK